MLTRKKNHSRKLVIAALLLGVVLVLGGLLYLRKRNSPKISPQPTPTINKLPTQPAANNGEKDVTAKPTKNDGTATDNQGQVTSPISTNSSQWLRSASGVITVKQPISGSIIKSGVELVGTAQASKVQYRLVDNQVGVISQGFINVVSGNFSANLSFQSRSSTGRLDVFTANDNGVESNEVQIPVNF